MTAYEIISNGVILIGLIAIPSLMIVGVVRGILRRKREALELEQRVHDAIDDITADGKVEGPRGPYVPHESWGTGAEAKTPHETSTSAHSSRGRAMEWK